MPEFFGKLMQEGDEPQREITPAGRASTDSTPEESPDTVHAEPEPEDEA